MAELKVQFPCGSLTLEGIWHLSGGEGVYPAVVVCHPHPLYGGDMHNGMVAAVCEELVAQGISALRFNFRGVGGSGGEFEEGIGEQEDIKAAISLAASSKFVDRARMGLCGYSFGAGVVLTVASKLKRVRALAAISPPLFIPGLERLENFTGPKFFIGGSEDSLFSAQDLARFVESLPEPTEHEIIRGADHFWLGHERKAAKKAADFFARVFYENR